MSVHVKAFIAIVLLGATAIIGYRFALPFLRDAAQRQTSDAAGLLGTLTIGIDNWVGYFPLCSPQMVARMRAAGYRIDCIDDGADNAGRMEKLANGQLDLAVATVDAYLVNGAQVDYPAAIIAVLDESSGGDAIVARAQTVPNLDALKQMTEARIAFTPASPSEHLLRSVSIHFDLPQWKASKASWKVEAQGSADALKRLQDGDADVAVLWEPDVSKALADPAFVKLIGTEDTQGLIVDVLLASRDTVQNQGEALDVLLVNYFATLSHYQGDRDEMLEDLSRYSKLDRVQSEALLEAVSWASLDDNGAYWFGITPSGLPEREALVDTIRETVSILVDSGEFTADPLPERDPYRITNRQFVADRYLPQRIEGAPASGAGEVDFVALDDNGWAKLREVGTLKIEPIGFARGTATLDESGLAQLEAIAQRLRHYPNFRLMIRGHTGLDGDSEANLALSKARAQAAAEYLLTQYDVDPDRVRALGYGASRPLTRLEGESQRSYGYRLPRVEFALLSEP